MRRIVLALLAVVAVLAGCDGSGDEKAAPAAVTASPTPSPTPSLTLASVQEIIRRGKAADPYAAHVSTTVDVSGTTFLTLVGEFNLNTTITGRARMSTYERDKQKVVDIVMTGKGAWARDLGTKTWRTTRRTVGNIDTFATMPAYAEALLGTGEDVLKGRERTESGVDAIRLSGSLTADQVRPVERRVYDLMRAQGVDEIEYDIWLGDEGRVVKVEQWSTIADLSTHTVTTLGDFRAPIAVGTPTSGGNA